METLIDRGHLRRLVEHTIFPTEGGYRPPAGSPAPSCTEAFADGLRPLSSPAVSHHSRPPGPGTRSPGKTDAEYSLRRSATTCPRRRFGRTNICSRVATVVGKSYSAWPSSNGPRRSIASYRRSRPALLRSSRVGRSETLRTTACISESGMTLMHSCKRSASSLRVNLRNEYKILVMAYITLTSYQYSCAQVAVPAHAPRARTGWNPC
jgi:hypothetical protein